MEFFEAVQRRRSVRKYISTPVPEAVVEKALDAALIAPNSSNMQTWLFYWVRSPEKKQKLVEACLSQGAARTAQELIVFVADANLWKKNNTEMVRLLPTLKLPPAAKQYYEKLIPFVYGWRVLAPIKFLIYNSIGLFRPIMRHPWSARDVDEVAIKSCALAAENFMLAIAAQDFDTCPMEGFDEWRVKRLLGLGCRARVVMVCSVGKRDPSRIWGEQLRFPRDWFVKKV